LNLRKEREYSKINLTLPLGKSSTESGKNPLTEKRIEFKIKTKMHQEKRIEDEIEKDLF